MRPDETFYENGQNAVWLLFVFLATLAWRAGYIYSDIRALRFPHNTLTSYPYHIYRYTFHTSLYILALQNLLSWILILLKNGYPAIPPT